VPPTAAYLSRKMNERVFCHRAKISLRILTAFSRKSSFATVVKFFNVIGLALNSSLDLKV